MKLSDFEGVSELMSFYKELETEITVARKAANFYCIEGCGSCCFTASRNLEVSLFEALPVALALIEQGVHEAVLAQLEDLVRDEVPCVLYVKKSDDGKVGGCSQYSPRPLICRLFGSSNKCGKSAASKEHLPIVCKSLKELHFENEETVAKLTKLLPIASTVSEIARALNPKLSGELFSINEAIRRALYYVLQRIEYGENV